MTTPPGRYRHRPAGAASRLLLVLAVVLPACTRDGSCDDLAALQAERDERRVEQQRLVDARTLGDDDAIAAADDRLHAVERRVFELEQRCER